MAPVYTDRRSRAPGDPLAGTASCAIGRALRLDHHRPGAFLPFVRKARLVGKPVSDFCRWLETQRQRKDAVGRIAKVIAYDRTFPRHSEKLTVLLKHFDKHAEHRAMLRHAHAVWRSVREQPSLSENIRRLGTVEGVIAWDPGLESGSYTVRGKCRKNADGTLDVVVTSIEPEK
jgi:uncharacterized protein YozE (UPF0346 family)